MHTLLIDLASCLVEHLQAKLPSLDANWWQRSVIDRLSIPQQRIAEEKRLTTLASLDLACLLRIFDQNWHELNAATRLPPESRNWLKEAQSIRNRWAHLPPSGLPPEDRYRDADTVLRLMNAIGAGEQAINHARECLDAARQAFSPPASTAAASAPNIDVTALRPGTLVKLRANSSITGAITAAMEGGEETRYQVFHDGVLTTYYASQLELAAPTAARPALPPDTLHAALSALQLRHPGIGHLYSLFASRVNFVPYQFRPVIKLIQSDRPRLLIADEVGVGKTIEAGLILKELQARRDIRSVLVVCPKPLVAERKWMDELKRFDEQFTHLDSATLRYCIEETRLDGVWPQQHARAILPYSLLDESLLMGNTQGRKKQPGLLELDPPPSFDLVIVDEAHHIRNTDTWAYRNVRHFCDNAEAVVLLSATPIQLGDNDLYTLLHLLRPDILPSRREFDQMAEPNPHINRAVDAVRGAAENWQDQARAALKQAQATIWGRNVITAETRLQEAFDLLALAPISLDERLTLLHTLEGLHTFAPLISRTRRRDIGNFTTRKPETVSIPYTPEQESLHHELIDLIGRMLARRHGDQNLQFMLTTVRRQVASCVFGLAPLFAALLDRHVTQVQISEMGDDAGPDELGDILNEFRSDIDALTEKARTLRGPDPKLDAFLNLVREKRGMDNHRLLVFSTFRHTLSYLFERLTHASVRVGMIHGDVPDDERRELRQRFRLDKSDPQAIDVLLSSEVGCEGLDFQFCDALVNYDLPWNPMRVEQRIGRIDRYGQKSETAVIYNFITPGTVDAEIYERCLLRIGVFRQALGGSEEILGSLTREIHAIAENLSLTDDERNARLQQLADNEIRLVQEQNRLEDEQSKLFGLALPKRDEELVASASSFWLSPAMLANLVAHYLRECGATNLPVSLGHKTVTTLQLGQDIRARLLTDFQALKANGALAQSWQRWLKGDDPYLAITFDQATAADRRDLAFITPTHPLARQAAHTIEPATPVQCNLRVSSTLAVPGRYPYAIYRWRELGLREDFAFQPVCLTPALNDNFLELLRDATPASHTGNLSTAEEQQLEDQHYRLWLQQRAEHIEQVAQTSQARLASLDTTHAARIALLEEQRDQTSDARIQRMRNAQLATAQQDYERHAAELKLAATQGDIIAEAVVFGVLEVGSEQ